MLYLKQGLLNTVKVIKEHKLIFTKTVILQLVLFAILTFLVVQYPPLILTDLQGIYAPLENANYNATSIQEGMPFTEDLPQVYASYKSLSGHLVEVLWWGAGLFLIINALLWVLTHRLFLGKRKALLVEIYDAGQAWGKYLAAVLVFAVLPLLILYFITYFVMQLGDENTILLMVQISAWCLLPILYLLGCAFAVISAPDLKSFAKQFWKVAVLNIHKTLLVILINLLVVGGMLALLVLTASWESLFLLSLFLALILIVAVVLVRIFFVGCVRHITDGEHENYSY